MLQSYYNNKTAGKTAKEIFKMSAERKGTGAKKQGNSNGNTLYNFSAYATAYENFADGSLKGVIVSGYANSDDGGRKYCNLWIPGLLVRVGKCKDGAPMLSIKMAAIAPPKTHEHDDDEEEDF